MMKPAPIAAPKQMADLTPQQRANLEATVASQQRIAMAIVAMPKDRGTVGIAKARSIFEDTIKQHGSMAKQGALGLLRWCAALKFWWRRSRRPVVMVVGPHSRRDQ